MCIQGHIFEGLMRYNEDNQLVGGVAQSWQLGTEKSIFKLRQDAKWSDGAPVTADDFVFAWQLAASPTNEYNFIMAPIKNAAQISRGELALSKLGVRALDSLTLEIEFDYPCAYFPALTSFISYMPIRRDFHQQFKDNEYASSADKMLYNGPFTLSHWKKETSLTMTKNESYWNSKKIWLNEINIPAITTQNKTIFNMYLSNDIAIASLGSDNIKSALINRLPIKPFKSGFISYLEFNQREASLCKSKKLRHAISLVINKQEIINKVIGSPGVQPTPSIFPSWLQGVEDKLTNEHKMADSELNLKKAKAIIAQYKQEKKVDSISLDLLLSEDETTKKLAEYLQFELKNKLGITLNLDIQTFKLRIAKSLEGKFDIVIGGWGPDYNDPMTFGDLFASWNQNNRGRFINNEYDELVEIAKNSLDQKLRMKCFWEMHEILHQEIPVIPIFETGGVYIQNPKVIGIQRNVLGADPNFTYARIEE